jgi:hypothetical protein
LTFGMGKENIVGGNEMVFKLNFIKIFYFF